MHVLLCRLLKLTVSSVAKIKPYFIYKTNRRELYFMDYNPHLQPWKRSEPNKEAGKGSIEIPDEIENIVHQTRSASPSDYENQLGEALESIFGDGVTELADIVDCLNKRGVHAPHGQKWTESSFCVEMSRLGA